MHFINQIVYVQGVSLKKIVYMPKMTARFEITIKSMKLTLKTVWIILLLFQEI